MGFSVFANLSLCFTRGHKTALCMETHRGTRLAGLDLEFVCWNCFKICLEGCQSWGGNKDARQLVAFEGLKLSAMVQTALRNRFPWPAFCQLLKHLQRPLGHMMPLEKKSEKEKVLTPLTTRDMHSTLKTNKQKQKLLPCRSGMSDVFAAPEVSQMGLLFLWTKPSCPCIFGTSLCLFGHLRRNFFHTAHSPVSTA